MKRLFTVSAILLALLLPLKSALATWYGSSHFICSCDSQSYQVLGLATGGGTLVNNTGALGNVGPSGGDTMVVGSYISNTAPPQPVNGFGAPAFGLVSSNGNYVLMIFNGNLVLFYTAGNLGWAETPQPEHSMPYPTWNIIKSLGSNFAEQFQLGTNGYLSLWEPALLSSGLPALRAVSAINYNQRFVWGPPSKGTHAVLQNTGDFQLLDGNNVQQWHTNTAGCTTLPCP